VEAPVREACPDGAAGGDFYAVGGAWRAFAKLVMARLDHRFAIVEGYAVDARTAGAIAEEVARAGTLAADDLRQVPKRRQEALPAAAYVLAGVLRALAPARVVFSAAGVREGRLFARLDPAARRRDPLLEAARRYGNVESRFGGVGAELVHWTGPLFTDETLAERRLRIAACHLSDVAWSTHPDYRAEYAVDRVLHLPLPGLGHAARGWLALAVYARYRGDLAKPQAREALALAGDDAERALGLGHALQLAYRLSGATAHLIAASRLERAPDRIALVLPDDGSLPLGDAVERRLQTLAKALGVARSEIRYADTNGGQPHALRAS
jgi:exopolyphosphatase/guanosine-5'-triphosphate,3'-diphosphate pyrophosphatase